MNPLIHAKTIQNVHKPTIVPDDEIGGTNTFRTENSFDVAPLLAYLGDGK
jgi:hypothetical protein